MTYYSHQKFADIASDHLATNELPVVLTPSPRVFLLPREAEGAVMVIGLVLCTLSRRIVFGFLAMEGRQAWMGKGIKEVKGGRWIG